MTSENRLDRIEAILEQTAQQQQTDQQRWQETREILNSSAQRWEETRRVVDSNARAIAANSAAIAELRITAQQTVTDTAQWFTGVVANMQEMQSEIRGLQVENRRILERLENREQ